MDIEFQLDTGATCNVLYYTDYNLLGCPCLMKTNTTITRYNDTSSTPLGWCQLQVKGEEGKITLKFLVLDVQQHSLLSMSTCLDMKLLHTSKSVHITTHNDLNSLLAEYEDVFEGLSMLPDEYDIQLQPDARPVQVSARKLPLSMKTEALNELDKMEQENVITKVKEPSEWISHMQPVRKANGDI